MTDDLISRRAAIAICEEPGYNGLAHSWHVIAKRIKELPSAQPERKTGAWIDSGEGRDFLYDTRGSRACARRYYCSLCGFLHTVIEESGRYAFCPNCGADMRGE